MPDALFCESARRAADVPPLGVDAGGGGGAALLSLSGRVPPPQPDTPSRAPPRRVRPPNCAPAPTPRHACAGAAPFPRGGGQVGHGNLHEAPPLATRVEEYPPPATRVEE